MLERRLGEPGRAAELIEELNALVVAELEHGVEAMVGARELLHALRERGTPIGLVSNSPLASCGARSRSSASRTASTSSSAPTKSPRRSRPPTPTWRPAAGSASRPGPAVVALEDSPTGVAAARAAGLTVIGVPSIEGIALEEAHHIAESLLDEVVARLLSRS